MASVYRQKNLKQHFIVMDLLYQFDKNLINVKTRKPSACKQVVAISPSIGLFIDTCSAESPTPSIVIFTQKFWVCHFIECIHGSCSSERLMNVTFWYLKYPDKLPIRTYLSALRGKFILKVHEGMTYMYTVSHNDVLKHHWSTRPHDVQSQWRIRKKRFSLYIIVQNGHSVYRFYANYVTSQQCTARQM